MNPRLPLPWQQSHWQSLMARHRAGRLPHALLLSGPAGLGKRHLATAFANALLCEQVEADGVACGTCRGCALFAAESHPDLLVVVPLEEGKELGIDQIRQISRTQALKSQYAKYKIVVLEAADRMTLSAANALLKTLEEPTPGTVLLLLTDRPESLLPTIRSRCQGIAFRPPQGEDAATWLQQQLPDRDEASLRTLLQVANRAPLKALAMAESDTLTRRTETLQLLTRLAARSENAVAAAETFADDRAEERLAWLQSWVADMVRLRSGGDEASLSNPDCAERLHGLAEKVDLRRLYAYLDKVQQARRLLMTSANNRLLLEELLALWVQVLAVPRGNG